MIKVFGNSVINFDFVVRSEIITNGLCVPYVYLLCKVDRKLLREHNLHGKDAEEYIKWMETERGCALNENV